MFIARDIRTIIRIKSRKIKINMHVLPAKAKALLKVREFPFALEMTLVLPN
jgi:hypothetical protein